MALLGCAPSSGRTEGGEVYLTTLDTLYTPHYASGFQFFSCGKSSLLQILSPWQGANGETKEVFLARNGETPPEGFQGEVIPLPLKRIVCMSSSYVAFLDALDHSDLICGISGAKFITTPTVVARIAEGHIADVGYDNSINYELLVSLKPDVIFVYGLQGENSAITTKLNELGLRVVYIGDYIENSPLGKAEWITVFGEFLDCRAEAEARFDTIRSQYEAIQHLASTVEKRPRVMLNAPWRDSWFVPGDQNYMVRLISDAGGEYACAGEDSDQSRPISTETAYLKALHSDIWLNPSSFNSLNDLLSANPRFREIPLVKKGQVYNNNARTTPSGGSDFWESGAVNPHLVLRDMIRIFHPELLPGHELYYFHRLP